MRFSISGITIHSINLTEIFGYVLNGLPQTHKEALCRGYDHALGSSHLVRLNIFEIVRYKTSRRSTFSGGLTRVTLAGSDLISVTENLVRFVILWINIHSCNISEILT